MKKRAAPEKGRSDLPTSLPSPGANGCAPLGVLSDFVRNLDEHTHACGLHDLTGGVYIAAANESAKERWLAAVRARFGVVEAASFEWEAVDTAPDIMVADPPSADSFAGALRTLKAEVAHARVGDAVLYWPGAAHPDPAAGPRVIAVATKCSDARAVGLVLVRAIGSAQDAADLARCVAVLAWHLRCADLAALSHRQQSPSLAPQELLEVLPLPCLVTDGAGRAFDRNKAFTGFMETAGLRIITGRVRFGDPYVQDSWEVALSEVELTAVRQSLLVAAADGMPWRVHLVPLRLALGRGAADRQAIVVFAQHDTGETQAAVEDMLVENAKPLTPAEEDVLDSVLQGLSAKVIASSRGASVNTVRSQIMAILSKTGHHNQKSLIAAFSPSSFRQSNSPSSTSGPPPTKNPRKR